MWCKRAEAARGDYATRWYESNCDLQRAFQEGDCRRGGEENIGSRPPGHEFWRRLCEQHEGVQNDFSDQLTKLPGGLAELASKEVGERFEAEALHVPVSDCPQSIVLVQTLRPLAVDLMLGPKDTWSGHRGASVSVLPVAGQKAGHVGKRSKIEESKTLVLEDQREDRQTTTSCDERLQEVHACDGRQQDEALRTGPEVLHVECLPCNSAEPSLVSFPSPEVGEGTVLKQHDDVKSGLQVPGFPPGHVHSVSLLDSVGKTARERKRLEQRKRIRQSMSLEIGIAQKWICNKELTRAITSKVLRRFWLNRLAERQKGSGGGAKLAKWILAVEGGARFRRSRTARVEILQIQDEIVAAAAVLVSADPRRSFEGQGGALSPSVHKDRQQQVVATTLSFAHTVSRQWVKFEGCRPGAKDTISLHAARELGLHGCDVGHMVRLSSKTVGASGSE